MKEIKLNSTDYVIVNKQTGKLLTFTGGELLIYGVKEEAENDKKDNEDVICVTDLAPVEREKLIERIREYE